MGISKSTCIWDKMIHYTNFGKNIIFTEQHHLKCISFNLLSLSLIFSYKEAHIHKSIYESDSYCQMYWRLLRSAGRNTLSFLLTSCNQIYTQWCQIYISYINMNEILYKECLRLIKTINNILGCNGNQFSRFFAISIENFSGLYREIV